MNVRPLFVANAQSSELIQPSERPLHDPAPSAHAPAMFGVSFRKRRDDASVTQTLPDRFGIITTVAQHAVRTMARTPRAHPARSERHQPSVSACCESLRLAPVSWDGQRDSASVANHMTLAAELRSVGRVETCLEAPQIYPTQTP